MFKSSLFIKNFVPSLHLQVASHSDFDNVPNFFDLSYRDVCDITCSYSDLSDALSPPNGEYASKPCIRSSKPFAVCVQKRFFQN